MSAHYAIRSRPYAQAAGALRQQRVRAIDSCGTLDRPHRFGKSYFEAQVISKQQHAAAKKGSSASELSAARVAGAPQGRRGPLPQTVSQLLRPAELLRLQRSVGNRAAGNLLRRGAHAQMIQRISDFSKWFLVHVLVPILKEILEKDKKAPKEIFFFLDGLDNYMKVDDSKEEQWYSAVMALKLLFEQIGNQGADRVVLGVIIVDNLIERIEEAVGGLKFDGNPQVKLISYLEALRNHIISSLGSESGEEDSNEEAPSDLSEVFETYPKITDPLRRPGHMNPYRHGIGAADTIAILSRDRKRLIGRVDGDDERALGLIEETFDELDQKIKAINDKEEKPILKQIVSLTEKKNKLIDSSKDMDVDTSEIDEQILELEKQLVIIRDGVKKECREKLRRLYERVFWISQINSEDVDEKARSRQIDEFFSLVDEKGFERSYQLADEKGGESFDLKQKIPPTETSHHSEQRAIVSKEWVKIRNDILTELELVLQDVDTIEDLEYLLTPTIVTMSINRSSCYVCNAFLVAELISLWKDIAKLLSGKLTWQQVRDLLRDVLTFEVTYSVPYSKVSDVKELDQQLALAGWLVSAHKDTEPSDDEGEHEKLSMGNAPSSKVKKGSRKSEKRKKKNDSDDEDFFEDLIEENPLVFLDKITRQIKIAEALKAFFVRLVKNRQSDNPIQTLQALGFTHRSMPGDGLNCALYSVQDQLEQLYGIVIKDFKEFAQYVRERAGLNFGTMIDVLNNGQAVLDAVVAYLVSKNLVKGGSMRLILDIWSAVGGGELMQFDNVARSSAGGQNHRLTLYYNGANHFDSLTGGFK